MKRQVEYTMLNVFVMFVTAVCFRFLFLQLKFSEKQELSVTSKIVH